MQPALIAILSQNESPGCVLRSTSTFLDSHWLPRILEGLSSPWGWMTRERPSTVSHLIVDEADRSIVSVLARSTVQHRERLVRTGSGQLIEFRPFVSRATMTPHDQPKGQRRVENPGINECVS